MDSHTIEALNRLEVVDTGRRRRWSKEEKARIVLESMSEPRLVAATARRYGLSRSLLVTWRRAFAANRAGADAGFVRAVVVEGGPVSSAAIPSRNATAHPPGQRIETELKSGRRIIGCMHRRRSTSPGHRGSGSAMIPVQTRESRFVWPSLADGVSISQAQMSYLLSGIDWRNPQESWRPTSVG
ncbi:IS66-like element accessory protein TnpA [Bradyrhizobium elkanii]|jgi:transposase|uniref:IS66-like element accessory protein TnpA n=1 Tax=Bradyrhizobium elkanii TaxID=29448 RepID=UPI00247CAB8A|nr:transposase-like protein [Bradyrhizobium elkanii]MCS3475052.1 transposase-like protein [Bradyrhizobium elkanii]MCS3521056.1 transposase-like protein [Bradyrhizobium elkanii]MCS4068711.1 transposase-like protein [Bradyrhizobium elkanii]MCS4084245.1 transposase-like protein [Bradyrhizobium elkanii]